MCNRIIIVIASGCLIFINTGASAEEFMLKNGDRISGALQSENDEAYFVKSEMAGYIEIPKANVLESKTNSEDPNTDDTTSDADKIEWRRELQAGYGVTQGNTNTEQANVGINVNRIHKQVDELSFKGRINYGSSG